jgi:hypothetical protein
MAVLTNPGPMKFPAHARLNYQISLIGPGEIPEGAWPEGAWIDTQTKLKRNSIDLADLEK